jgi:hypothetical protein
MDIQKIISKFIKLVPPSGVRGLGLLLLFTSCTKEIDIDLNAASPKIVIEANLTNEAQSAVVKISKTVNFNATNSYPPVGNAKVAIADNAGNTYNLTEKETGTYQLPTLKGVSGRIYTLNVQVEGTTYTAICKMPNFVPLTGLAPLQSPSPFDKTDTSYVIRPIFKDPVGLGNSYRFIQTLNGIKDPSINVSNDNTFDGLVNQRPVAGANRDVKIRKGDKVEIELQSIDNPIYDYFYSLNPGAGPGGGTTPANPITNLKGGALGYFSVSAVDRKSLVVR